MPATGYLPEANNEFVYYIEIEGGLFAAVFIVIMLIIVFVIYRNTKNIK
jgi:hypothetical protein